MSTRATPSRLRRVMRRVRHIVFLIHRWLGVALSLVMALWALTGVVMMYVSYPQTTEAERLAGLDPLDLSSCCGGVDIPPGPIDGATVEMLTGEPVLRWIGPDGPRLASLSGTGTVTIDEALAGEIARAHFRNTFGTELAMRIEPVESDQWTIQIRHYAPLWKASFADGRGTELYVSGLTGQVVLDTHSRERLWNWLGAVPHWLYFRALRENGALWSQTVIWASLLGAFLTVTGIYVGLVTLRRGRRHSPFRGVALWHHWFGLVFGLATLTWVFSGFASMNPWGWLESEGPGREVQTLAGRVLDPADAEALYRALAANPGPEIVSAEAIVQGGQPFAVLVHADGTRERAALPDLAPAPLSPHRLAALARSAKPGVEIVSQGPIREGDAYYYSHHSTPAVLPAWRAIYADKAETRLYFDPRTGELIGYADPARRGFRWWHLALHRLDLAGLRERPLWDAVMLALLAGVSLLCLLGVWMGVRRVRRDLRRAAARARRK